MDGLARCRLGAAAARLRLGDDPQRVFEDAQATLPLPAFRATTKRSRRVAASGSGRRFSLCAHGR